MTDNGPLAAQHRAASSGPMSARRSTHASGSHYTGRSRLASRSGAASRASSTRFAGSHIAGVAHTSASASVAASRRGTGYTAAGSRAGGVQAPPTSHWERQLRDVKAEAVQARRNQFVSPKPRVVDSYDFEEGSCAQHRDVQRRGSVCTPCPRCRYRVQLY